MNSIREEHYKWIWTAVFLIGAVLCFTLIHDLYLNWGFTEYAINYLDNKANTVLALTGASTSASVAITMVPGDVGTPIASQLANISSYSIIVLAAVHLEKYLITLAAVIALRFLMPISLVAAALNTAWLENPALKALIKKICAFSVALVLVVPTSVYLSTLIDNTYQDDVQLSIEQTMQEAEQIKYTLQSKDDSLWDKFVKTIEGGTMELVSKFENSLNNFVEAISVMLITGCAIPILTFAVLIWLVKSVLQIDLKAPSLAEIAYYSRLDPKRIMERRHGRIEHEPREQKEA